MPTAATVTAIVLSAALPFCLPSDPQAAYATIDKVVLLPSAEQPTTVELHGAFALAEGRRGSYYRAPRTGVLRLAAGKDVAAAQAQWRDLQLAAGTGKVVAFGSRYEALAEGTVAWRVAGADEPAAPELPAWSTGFGLQVLDNVEYGAARELALLPRCLPLDLGTERRSAVAPARSVVFSCANCQAADAGLCYVFTVESSDGERFASPPQAPGKGITTWTVTMALQVGEKLTWSVHVVSDKVERAPIDSAQFVVPAAAVERRQ